MAMIDMWPVVWGAKMTGKLWELG